jgi:hypothetical protein
MKQTRDELEYTISQYLDGTLLPLERSALEERLAVDAEARELLEEYRQLNASLKAMPLPNIAWDKLQGSIVKTLQTHETPIKHYSIGAISWSGRLAIAAVLLFGISVGVFIVNRNMPAANPAAPSPSAVVAISGPAPEQPKGNVVADISIGPSPTLAAGNWRTSDEIVSRPTVVLIDQARFGGQDTEQNPY